MRTGFFQHGIALLTAASFAVAAGPTMATEAGLRRLENAAQGVGPEPAQVVLFYPTQESAKAIPMGPFTPTVAINGKPDATVKGLIVLSHGTGGSELGHSSLAVSLARNGYLVAAIRHPGDNWQDQSLLGMPGGKYFDERPRQVSRVIDSILNDPEWKPRIAADANGARIGALGHSAGGYTVLALAGGVPEPKRIITHCKTDRDDPVFCSMGRPEFGKGLEGKSFDGLRDPRVRAVVAMAPVGVVLTAQSLATIDIPATIYSGVKDTFLVARYHADWIRQNLARAEYHAIPNAGHFAFLDTPSMPIPSADGDIGANPQGFDRAAFLKQLASEVVRFFDRVLK